MPSRPRQLRIAGRFAIRPTESYRRKLVAATLARLGFGALLLLALCWSLA